MSATKPPSLQSLVFRAADISHNPSPKGWHTLSCRVCNDHAHKKRAGFRFDGSITSYNCFNCKAKFVFDEDDANSIISKGLIQVCEAYGIDIKAVKALQLFAKRSGGKGGHLRDSKPIQRLGYPTITLPPYFKPLLECPENDPWVQVAKAHLEHERQIDPNDYPFYMVIPTAESPIEEKRWSRRLIIPYFNEDNQVIFYQGRDLTDGANMRAKYRSPDGVDKPLAGLQNLHQDTGPLFITEGFFKSYHLKGVGVLGNEITDTHAAILEQSRRRKIYIPDKLGDGHVPALQAIKRGWAVALPDIGACKDIDEAIVKYGLLYVAKSIMDNTYEGRAAELRVHLWCR